MAAEPISTLKRMVESVLQDTPAARDSDITLTIEIWKRFYPQRVYGGTVRLTDLYDLPREDNVKRVRAKFQNEDKLYLPTTWEIAKARGIEEDVWRTALGYPPKAERQIDRFV
jgi:hypothetical protein